MTLFPEHGDAELEWEGVQSTHEIMYVVKRPSYELYLAVPRTPLPHPRQGQPLILLRVKRQGQPQSVVLELPELEDVFDGMERLLAYLGIEEAKRQARL
jgi:hypothetical protein